MPGTILVVDDDPEFISQMDGILSAAGHRVLTYLDSRAAMADLERLRGAIDAAVVGAELSGRVKTVLPGVKVISILPSGARAPAGAAGLVIMRPGPGERLDPQRWVSALEDLLGGEKAA